jgi:hypothetical protein
MPSPTYTLFRNAISASSRSSALWRPRPRTSARIIGTNKRGEEVVLAWQFGGELGLLPQWRCLKLVNVSGARPRAGAGMKLSDDADLRERYRSRYQCSRTQAAVRRVAVAHTVSERNARTLEPAIVRHYVPRCEHCDAIHTSRAGQWMASSLCARNDADRTRNLAPSAQSRRTKTNATLSQIRTHSLHVAAVPSKWQPAAPMRGRAQSNFVGIQIVWLTRK